MGSAMQSQKDKHSEVESNDPEQTIAASFDTDKERLNLKNAMFILLQWSHTLKRWEIADVGGVRISVAQGGWLLVCECRQGCPIDNPMKKRLRNNY